MNIKLTREQHKRLVELVECQIECEANSSLVRVLTTFPEFGYDPELEVFGITKLLDLREALLK